MLRTGNRLILILWGVPLLAACSVAQTNVFRPGMQVMRPTGRRPPAPLAAAPVQAAPIPATAASAPVPMSQGAATPPHVSYQGGMLTIVAENSNLGDILREVHRLTGATIDVPSNATERVVTHLGPGPARDVLADLLNGSTFNYVMLGTTSDPASVASVMLTMKPAGSGGNTQTAANVYQPTPETYAVQQGIMPPGAGPGGPVVQQPADDEADADAEDKDEEDSADEAQADQAQNGATPADGSQPNPGSPKTPEQILEMLRQRQGQMAPGQQMIPKPTPPDDNN